RHINAVQAGPRCALSFARAPRRTPNERWIAPQPARSTVGGGWLTGMLTPGARGAGELRALLHGVVDRLPAGEHFAADGADHREAGHNDQAHDQGVFENL